MATRNRREKRTLVEKGQAHGVIIYENEEPVGWCQYGPKEELPGSTTVQGIEDSILRMAQITGRGGLPVLLFTRIIEVTAWQVAR